ncbi:hypothetical protein GCM10017581_073320 [Dactylosporangium matsuzakiense]|uniref:Uncharacterized protein n=1 Tax=Dactylosporangium matsuzakiense TaxID=53360 RepID=A0A9W6KSH0_9ACTN|nr:hypothetical protein [Dactylosporangium matsuzakiense]GLL05585.1 hypothetical protein GCM10017581_073320 [Dactylosporangium matsuzakiense]
MQQRGREGDPGGAADQEDAADVLGGDAGTAQERDRQRHSAVQVGAGGELELLPGQVQVLADQRQVQVRGRVPGQLLLRGPGPDPERAPGLLVLRALRPVEPGPGLGGAGGERAGVLDDGGVEVQPADVGEPGGGHDLERGPDPHDAHVERAGAEVVHDHALPGPQIPDGCEVRRRGHRLRHEADLAQPGPGGGVGEDRQPGPAPGGRVGEDDLTDRGAGDPPGLVRDPAQDRGQELGDRVLALAEPHGALVDASLRVRLQPGRPGGRGPLGVQPGEQVRAGAGEHGRGQQGRGVEQERTDRPRAG